MGRKPTKPKHHLNTLTHTHTAEVSGMQKTETSSLGPMHQTKHWLKVQLDQHGRSDGEKS